MKTTLNFSQFCDEWKHWDDRKDTFSYEGKKALFEYLENYEEETGEEIELDIVALCCDYTEYESAWDAMKEYQPEDMPVGGEPGDDLIEINEKNEKAAREWLEERTQVIDVEGGRIIIQQF